MAHRVVAGGSGKRVVAGICAREGAHRFDTRVAAGLEVAAGAGVARGAHGHRGRSQDVAANRVAEAGHARRQRRGVDRTARSDAAGQGQLAHRVVAGGSGKRVVARIRAG